MAAAATAAPSLLVKQAETEVTAPRSQALLPSCSPQWLATAAALRSETNPRRARPRKPQPDPSENSRLLPILRPKDLPRDDWAELYRIPPRGAGGDLMYTVGHTNSCTGKMAGTWADVRTGHQTGEPAGQQPAMIRYHTSLVWRARSNSSF